ncbi:MAG: gluconokinase [Candidatus Coatesbacteria bacterium]
MPLVLAADVGTTATKAGVVDVHGRVLAHAEEPNPVRSPEPGAAEHDPEQLWRTLCRLSRRVARGREDRIKAVVLTGYQLGLLPLDARQRPLGGVITLLDMRSMETFRGLEAACDAKALYRRTGCPPFAPYPLAKVWWLRHRRPALFRRARWLVGGKDWLLLRMTGRLATEASLSSATWMLNIRTGDWDPMALRLAGVAKTRMPEVIPPFAAMGGLRPQAAEALGLAPGTLVAPGIYDAAALLVGLGGLEPGVAAVNFGTTAMMRIVTRRPVLDREMRLQAYSFDGTRWLGGSGVNNAGNGRAWLRGRLGLGSDAELDALAAKVPPGSEGVKFLPYFTGERDPRIGNVAASILGLREGHGPGHLARAQLEGVAYTIRMIRDALRENGVTIREIRLGGAGAKSPLWVRIIADVLNVPVTVPAVAHPSLVGCAAIGYAATGLCRTVDEAARRLSRSGRRVRPDPRSASVYARGITEHMALVSRLYGG